MSKYNELVKKLKEIFQIDRPELDFGIYRILNAKADEINNYLENTLKQKISDALATAGNANKAELEKQLSAAIKAAEDAGFNAEDSPKVKDLRQQIITTSQGANEHENAVFTHLLSFFSRYYDSGDFVSKRRYKGDTYAIPYAGEEVMLHWANKDQYYIKSGENFANYSFKLDDGRKVSFKLLAADTAKDNRKDNDADRRFVLIEPHTRTKFDNEGNEFNEEYQPVTVVKSDETEELVIQFEYKAVKKGTKQDALVTDALQTVLSHELVQSGWADITKREPTEKNPNRTLLEKHLTTYTQRNTADYFIHKDLGGFLSNELDFYIKNEVMNLDNVQNAEVFADIEKQLRMIQCLRSISKDIIAFLSQLENFQRKLWEKRKFVVKTEYSIAYKLLPDELKQQALSNKKQVERWQELGFITDKELVLGNLDSYNSLPVDTSLFDYQFKEKALNSLSNIDKSIDGYLYNSDNYQALNLISTKFKSKIDSIYIDPPYNTNASEIFYKNGYKESSWNSLIFDRIRLGNKLLNENGIHVFTIDDYELENSIFLNNSVFGVDNHLATVPIRNNPQGRSTVSGFSVNHEYAIFHRKSEKVKTVGRLDRSEAQDNRYKEIDDDGKRFLWENFRKTGTDSSRTDRPKQFYPIWFNEDGFLKIPKMRWDNKSNRWDVIEEKGGFGEVLPIDSTGHHRVWKWGIERAQNELAHIKIETVRGQKEIYRRNYINDEGKLPGTWWDDASYAAGSHGTNLLSSMFSTERLFLFPKSYKAVEDCLRVANVPKDGIVLDFFAGSASTGHAVVSLNKKDQGSRKCVLIEQGEYFEKVTKPRLQKVAYSDSWKKGKPTSVDDSNQVLKIVNLESYEDSLNNLELKKTQQTSDLFEMMNEDAKSDYLFNYMLETESKGSLLNTSDFRKPFDYKMKIAVDSAGASEEQNVDLVETFNYLIGLHVNTIESNVDRGYVRIEGTLPSGERALVLWRDCEKIQYDDFTKFASRFDLFAKQKTFDVIYVNGDHNLPTAFTDEGADGVESTRTLKLRQIEPEFLEQMFAPDELA